MFFCLLFRECSQKHNFKVEYAEPLLVSFLDSIDFLSKTDAPSLHIELGHVLSWFPYFKQPNENFVAFFDSFYNTFGTCSIYFPAAAGACAFGGIFCKLLTNSYIYYAISSGIPSRAVHCLRCDGTLLHPHASSEASTYFSSMYYSIVDVFSSYSHNPIVSDYLLYNVKLISKSKNLVQLRQLVLPGLVTKCQREKGETSKQILEILTPTQPKKSSDLMRSFLASPSVEKGDQMIEMAIQEDMLAGCATMVIGNISVITSNFLTVLLVFRRTIKKLEASKGLELQKELMNEMIDSLNLGDRGEALKLVVNGGDLSKAADLAAKSDFIV